MLDELLGCLNNWFELGQYWGTFKISGGTIERPSLSEGQYFRIVGSKFNDGLYQYPANDLQDETYTGELWELAVPKAVIKLAEDIEEWKEKYGNAAASPYQAESFGGYSYTKKFGGENAASGWEEAFSSRLSRWRKI